MKRAIRIKTDHSVDLVEYESYRDLASLIGAEHIERVHGFTDLHGHIMVVDDSGLISDRPVNGVASLFYGSALHRQKIAGDVLICQEDDFGDGIDFVDMEEVPFWLKYYQTVAEVPSRS